MMPENKLYSTNLDIYLIEVAFLLLLVFFEVLQVRGMREEYTCKYRDPELSRDFLFPVIVTGRA